MSTRKGRYSLSQFLCKRQCQYSPREQPVYLGQDAGDGYLETLRNFKVEKQIIQSSVFGAKHARELIAGIRAQKNT